MMELRVLQYFLAIAREQSISAAAQALHVSQPALSVQIQNLERELGKSLFIRSTKGSRGIQLTEEVILLRDRGEEILELVRKTEQAIASSEDTIVGDVHIGAGESDILHVFAQAAKILQKRYPHIHYHIASGNSTYVLEQLDKGLIDFGLLYGAIDHAKYESIQLPLKDTYGVLMRKDSPLASKAAISPEDLWDKPLIVSRQEEKNGWPLQTWIKKEISQLNIVATYTLIYNGSILVDEGIGYAICFDKLINTKDSNLCFIPLTPIREETPSIIWKKYHFHTKASEKYLETLKDLFRKIAEERSSK